jgi:hypothetical protein
LNQNVCQLLVIFEVPGIQLTFVTEWVEDIVCQLSFLSPTGTTARLPLSEKINLQGKSVALLKKVLDCNSAIEM